MVPIQLLFKAAPAPQSWSPNLLHKAVPQSRSPNLESCSEQLLSLPPKVVSESGFPKFLSKTIPQSCRSSKQLFVNATAQPKSCSPQLLPKAALQSCYRKPRPKEAPQNSKAAARSCLKAGPESCPKLFPGAAPQEVVPQSCSPKLLPQSWDSANLFTKTAPQSHSAKQLPKAAPQSCYQKLLPKAAVQSYCPKVAILQTYSPKQLPKAILQRGSTCSRKLLLKAAPRSCKAAPESCSVPESCSGKLAKAAPQSGSPKLLPKAVPQSTSATRLPQSGYAAMLQTCF